MNQKDRIFRISRQRNYFSRGSSSLTRKKWVKRLSAKEQPTSSQVDSVLEGVASVFTKFSAQSDQTDESIQAVLKRTKEN